MVGIHCGPDHHGHQGPGVILREPWFWGLLVLAGFVIKGIYDIYRR